MEKLNIINQKENKLFNRKEVQVSLDSPVTPSKVEVEKSLSEQFSAPVEVIAVKKISNKFGSKSFTIIANIYTSEEDKKKIEPKIKEKKK